jgi:hypothetical protein
MIDNDILWSRTIDPISGKIVKEETFLNAALTFLALCGAVAVIAVLVSIL